VGICAISGSEVLLIGSQFRQQPPYLTHVGRTAGPQLIQPRHQVPNRVGRSAGTHYLNLIRGTSAPHERGHGFILGG